MIPSRYEVGAAPPGCHRWCSDKLEAVEDFRSDILKCLEYFLYGPRTSSISLGSAALQFSSAADVAVALVVGARSAQQIQEDWNSLQTKIPSDFWAELKEQGLIEANAALPALPA